MAVVQNNKTYYQNCIEGAYERDENNCHFIHDCSMSLVVLPSVSHFFPEWLSNIFCPFLHELNLCPALVIHCYPGAADLALCLRFLTPHHPSSKAHTPPFSCNNLLVQVHLLSNSVGKSSKRNVCNLSYFNRVCWNFYLYLIVYLPLSHWQRN